MSAGIEAATAAACRALPAVAGLPAGSRVLDIGGGTGSWAIALAAADPALTATVLELADVAPIAESHVARVRILRPGRRPRRGRSSRRAARGISTRSCSPTSCTTSPRRRTVRSCDESGRRHRPERRLLLADFWTDPTHTQPLPAALMAGEFAIHLNDGDVYSVEEATAWLTATGWRAHRTHAARRTDQSRRSQDSLTDLSGGAAIRVSPRVSTDRNAAETPGRPTSAAAMIHRMCASDATC